MPERKSNRRSYRPGGGEFSPPSGLFSSQEDLRGRFMEIVWSEFPELQNSLQALYEKELAERLTELVQTADIFAAGRQQVEPVVKAWAETWRLTDDWCVTWLLGAWRLTDDGRIELLSGSRLYDTAPSRPTDRVDIIHEVRDATGRGDIARMTLIDHPAGRRLFQLTAVWDYERTTQAAFKIELRGRFEAELNDYCGTVLADAKAAGHLANPELRQVDEHLRWLARMIIKGERPADIWRSVSGDNRGRRAFEKAIRKTAELIGLTLRNDREPSS
jgi:hypothetical protein